MKIISAISIECFRSIKSATTSDLGNLNTLAGLNNSGKSNFLRALNLFFSGETDPDHQVDLGKDYFRHDLGRKKAKKISVAVTFSLPSSFRFRKGLESVRALLGGTNFTIGKTWSRLSPRPTYSLNSQVLDVQDSLRIDQFLALIAFRYIPNRVLPLDIIRSEHRSLRDVLVRRLAKKAKDQAEVFGAIRNTSADMISGLFTGVHDACPDVNSIRLDTPVSWQDMIFAFGYKLGSEKVEIEDALQGSGIQSLLMLQTLALIDRDYFQKFGWKQAAIWALEEPESSLHSSLEARVASYLAGIANEHSSRLQIFTTTHSDIVLQYSDRAALVSMSQGSSFISPLDKKQVLQEAAAQGISRWVHPILMSPLKPLVLVEGKFDHPFVEYGLRQFCPGLECEVSYLGQLSGGSTTGGVDRLLAYMKESASAIKTRISTFPIIVLLDWEVSTGKKSEFERILSNQDPYRVLIWPADALNPKADASFHGIERAYSDRLLREADLEGTLLGRTSAGVFTISSDNYPKLKQNAFRVVTKGLHPDDFLHAKPVFDEIQSLINSFR